MRPAPQLVAVSFYLKCSYCEGKTICRGGALIVISHIYKCAVWASWEAERCYGAFFIYHQPFVRVAKVGETLTDSQSILTYYILSTTSLRQTNRTSKIHLLLWSADISWKITLQHYPASLEEHALYSDSVFQHSFFIQVPILYYTAGEGLRGGWILKEQHTQR